jgi:hypothetical protein
VRRRASAARQWLGGRRGPNSGEWSGGAGQCVCARASVSPGGELRVSDGSSGERMMELDGDALMACDGE